MAVVLAVLPLSFTAFAAEPFCTGALSPLYCFQPNAPAAADEVNANFATLGNAIVNKTGALSSTEVAVANKLTFGTNARQLIDLASGANIGTQATPLQTVYSRVPSGGLFRWYEGGAHAAGGPGGGVDLMALNNTGGLSVKGVQVRPSLIVRNNCASATCSLTCPTGRTIKMAFGFHGLQVTGTSNDLVCGGGFSWLGSCENQGSCTVTTPASGRSAGDRDAELTHPPRSCPMRG